MVIQRNFYPRKENDFEKISKEKLVDVKTYQSTEKLVKSFVLAGQKLENYRNFELQKDTIQDFGNPGEFYQETGFDLDNLHEVQQKAKNEIINNLKNDNEQTSAIVEPSTQDLPNQKENSNPTDSQES